MEDTYKYRIIEVYGRELISQVHGACLFRSTRPTWDLWIILSRMNFPPLAPSAQSVLSSVPTGNLCVSNRDCADPC